jgi:hypothetical protein
MFRFYTYYSKHNDPTAAIALRSEKFSDRTLCEIALNDMLAVPGFTGGGVEQHVPGIGWVLFLDVVGGED